MIRAASMMSRIGSLPFKDNSVRSEKMFLEEERDVEVTLEVVAADVVV
jgi:hypothetical protein